MYQYFLSPFCALIIVLIIYLVFPIEEHFMSLSITILFIYMVLSMNVYPVLISGWASNSKYSLIGSLRSVAQTVSYEVSLALILMFYLSLTIKMNLFIFIKINLFWNKLIIFIPLVAIWLISCLAETNRTPFDFAEGESELVSGFNIEYGGLGFALIFIAEYARIIFIRIIFRFIFIRASSLSIFSYLFSVLLISVWIWVRTTFPRYRYDKLMNLAWKTYLPITLLLLIFSFMFIIY